MSCTKRSILGKGVAPNYICPLCKKDVNWTNPTIETIHYTLNGRGRFKAITCFHESCYNKLPKADKCAVIKEE